MSGVSIEIKNLINCPEVIPRLAQWFENQWAEMGDTVEYGMDWLQSTIEHSDLLPVLFVAFTGMEPVGAGLIMLDQVPEKPQYNPWLGYWYVLPDYRNQGIGNAILEKRLQYLRENDFSKVYIFTTTQETSRAKRGWKTVERAVCFEKEGVIMSLSLSESPRIALDNKRLDGSATRERF